MHFGIDFRSAFIIYTCLLSYIYEALTNKERKRYNENNHTIPQYMFMRTLNFTGEQQKK